MMFKFGKEKYDNILECGTKKTLIRADKYLDK